MTNIFSAQIAAALDASAALAQVPVTEQGEGEWPAWFAVTDLASACIGAAASEIAALAKLSSTPVVAVDRRLASLWFAWSLRPNGWQMPAPWDSVAGDYAARDGWIKLHTNAPHHREAALEVLGVAADRFAVTAAVANWHKEELESAIVANAGCAAAMRSMADWASHPQGLAVQSEPLISWQQNVAEVAKDTPDSRPSDSLAPLDGLRVLDLTRVLAGPVASRFLARFGAEVLRIDPPSWEEPGVIPEVTLGKRCAGLDLRNADDRQCFSKLLQDADILLHGYRPGALDNLGYSREQRLALNPQLIDVSLSAYGWSGPWASRRGFDSLVQMSSGIAEFGMQNASANKPTPLPVQALDHATGYLLASAALRALRLRREQGALFSAQLSLARTGAMLAKTSRTEPGETFAEETSADQDPWLEDTAWGPAQRLRFPVKITGVPQHWPHPASALRSSQPSWQTKAL